MDIVCDFMEDWRGIVLRELQQIDPAINVNMDTSELCFQFVNWRWRKISQVPRAITISREFQCPADRVAGLDLVKDKIIHGNNLTPHLSTRLTNLEFDDGLLNDWGIYHLHLGTVPYAKNPAFIDRTDDVLMARFDEKMAYLIDIAHHGDWARLRLLEIVHRNWPESLAPYRMNVQRLEGTISDADRAALRRGGVMALTEVDDAVYMPPGGGITTSGLGVNVVETCDRIVYSLRGYEAQMKTQATNVAQVFQRHGATIGDTLKLEMQTDFDTVFVVDKGSGQRLHLGALVR